MAEPKRVSLYWIVAFALIATMIVFNVHASGDDIEQNVKTIVTGGDNTAENSALVSGSRAYSLAAPGLADVDIAQCLGSTSWSLLVGGRQKLVLNHVCMAEFYLKAGKYDLAAQSLCNQREILVEYDTEESCESAHDFEPVELESDPMSNDPHKDDEDYHVEQKMAYEGLQAQLQELQQQVQRPKPTVIERTVIEQKPLLTEAKRAKLMAILEEK